MTHHRRAGVPTCWSTPPARRCRPQIRAAGSVPSSVPAAVPGVVPAGGTSTTGSASTTTGSAGGRGSAVAGGTSAAPSSRPPPAFAAPTTAAAAPAAAAPRPAATALPENPARPLSPSDAAASSTPGVPPPAPVAYPSSSMNALNRSRSFAARFSTTPSASPTFSTRPSGAYSRDRYTEVCPPPRSSNVTAPAFVAPSVAAHATLESRTCSRIRASHSRFTPAISATHLRGSSPSWVTDFTPPMNRGKSSNWVHWLYATLTGTFTRTDCSTFVVMTSPRPTARRAAALHPAGPACARSPGSARRRPACGPRSPGHGPRSAGERDDARDDEADRDRPQRDRDRLPGEDAGAGDPGRGQRRRGEVRRDQQRAEQAHAGDPVAGEGAVELLPARARGRRRPAAPRDDGLPGARAHRHDQQDGEEVAGDRRDGGGHGVDPADHADGRGALALHERDGAGERDACGLEPVGELGDELLELGDDVEQSHGDLRGAAGVVPGVPPANGARAGCGSGAVSPGSVRSRAPARDGCHARTVGAWLAGGEWRGRGRTAPGRTRAG